MIDNTFRVLVFAVLPLVTNASESVKKQVSYAIVGFFLLFILATIFYCVIEYYCRSSCCFESETSVSQEPVLTSIRVINVDDLPGLDVQSGAPPKYDIFQPPSYESLFPKESPVH